MHRFRAALLLLPILFIILWGSAAYQAVVPKLPSEAAPPILYSTQLGPHLQVTLVEAIASAQDSIHLISFGLTDKAVLKALQEKAHLPIKIYYDTRGSPNIKEILQGIEVYPITDSGLLHQKILVVDKKMAFLGSANFTKTSLRLHDNLMIGFYSPPLAQFLIDKAPFSPSSLHTSINHQQIDLWILPDKKQVALEHLKKIFRQAKQHISVAMFTLTHSVLVDEMIAAKQRGIEVELFIDRHSAMGASARAVEKLKKHSIPIFCSRGTKLLHHKFLYVDGRVLVLGSTNWTKAAFSKNRDCFLSLYPLTSQQTDFMDTLCKKMRSESKL